MDIEHLVGIERFVRGLVDDVGGHVLEPVVVPIGTHVDGAETRRFAEDLGQHLGHDVPNLVQSRVRHPAGLVALRKA